MSHRGTFYAITPDEAEPLLALVGDDDALSRNVLELYSIERHKSHFITPVDKTWDPIHRCLTDGTLRLLGKGQTPLSQCVLGSRSLHAGTHRIVCYVSAEQVPIISQALEAIEIRWFYQQFFNLPSRGFTGPITDEEFQFTWEYFTSIRNLFERAATHNRAIVFVAD
jgi:hypothetical protein